MVDFIPFRGLVPNLGAGESIEDRVSPPYDVIGEEALRLLQAKECNVTRITLGADSGSYEKAAGLLRKWISEDRLRKDGEECFYLLRQTFFQDGKELTRTGLMGALRLEPYQEGHISPHEETFSKVKEDRLNLLRATGTHLESIFCLCDHLDQGLMADIIQEATMLYEVSDGDGTQHAFGRISDRSLLGRITDALAGKRLLIADGHHRYETALRYSTDNLDDPKKGYVLATIVPGNDPGLAVMPTHRIFGGLEITSEEFLHRASNFFATWEVGSLEEIIKLLSMDERVSLGILTADGRKFVFELAWRPTEDPLWAVDAYVCEELILKKILKKKGEVSVDYDHDARSVARKMGEGVGAVAVILSPPKLDVVWRVAAEGERMPKKSTYFYPKVWSGFVAYDMR